ncbi:MAG TPA: hypothetical protein VE467_10860, partial [Chryseolinea sp.]|nr:hypothetical protein [Chryseolinea sp.]
RINPINPISAKINANTFIIKRFLWIGKSNHVPHTGAPKFYCIENFRQIVWINCQVLLTLIFHIV